MTALEQLEELRTQKQAYEELLAETMEAISDLLPQARTEGFSFEKIAKAAGVTRPTVYAMLSRREPTN